MDNLLFEQVNEVLARASGRTVLAYERALRVGAATLRNGAAGAIAATTVVCEVDTADLDSFEALIADIADEFGLQATIRQHPGSYSVRFTSPAPAPASGGLARQSGIRALLARVLAR